ncbi:hypothetical protein [Corynebacterium sp.]|uniref:hypothetical protein n=1 Tax=Corynebacterium sp. TaxID=1720 RepID=UPI0026DB28D3|nr:hypothetical protein [Corynebacterium sp.]MDO5077066.1 hypothetical protein [Corynebacterium sp.]
MSNTAALVGGYGTAVADLQAASRGLWGGPVLSPTALADAASAVDGTDPEALVTHTQLAAGEHLDPIETDGLFDELRGLAEGTITDVLRALSVECEDYRQAGQDMQQRASECAAAIHTIAEDSGATLRAMCEELQRLIAVLCAQLNTLDPQGHAAAFRGCIDAAADLIDRAGTLLMGVCQDRDEALGQCYDTLLGFGEELGARPAPDVPGLIGQPLMGVMNIGVALASLAQAVSEGALTDGVETTPADETPPAEAPPVETPPAEAQAPEVPPDPAPQPAPPLEPVAEPEPASEPVRPAQEPTGSTVGECTVPAAEGPVGGTLKRGGARKAGAW